MMRINFVQALQLRNAADVASYQERGQSRQVLRRYTISRRRIARDDVVYSRRLGPGGSDLRRRDEPIRLFEISCGLALKLDHSDVDVSGFSGTILPDTAPTAKGPWTIGAVCKEWWRVVTGLEAHVCGRQKKAEVVHHEWDGRPRDVE